MPNKAIPDLTAVTPPVDRASLIELSIPGGGSRKATLTQAYSPVVQDITTGASPIDITEPFADVYVITTGGTKGVEEINLPAFADYAEENIGKQIVLTVGTPTAGDDSVHIIYLAGDFATLKAEEHACVSFVCDGKRWLWDKYFSFISESHAEGYKSNAEGISTFATGEASNAEGNSTVASGNNSSARGLSTTAAGENSSTEGFNTTAQAPNSRAIGDSTRAEGDGSYASGRASRAVILYSHAYASGCFDAPGDAQHKKLSIRVTTSDDTEYTMTTDADNTPSATNQMSLLDNSAVGFHGTVEARETATGDCSYWEYKGLIKRDTEEASTTLVAAVTPTMIAQSAGASAWVVAVVADTTNGAISIKVTGETSKIIRWLAEIHASELVQAP